MLRLEPARIVAISVALAIHIALGLLLLRPFSALRTPRDSSSDLTVEIVRVQPPPIPPPPSQAVEAKPRQVHELTSKRPTDSVDQEAPPALAADLGWEFDPQATPAVIVYGTKPELDLLHADEPAQEIAYFRDSFDPSRIDGLNGDDSGGLVVFDVLVDELGQPAALTVTRQESTQRALETAMAVVSQWRFKPATKQGLPVQSWLEVALEF